MSNFLDIEKVEEISQKDIEKYKKICEDGGLNESYLKRIKIIEEIKRKAEEEKKRKKEAEELAKKLQEEIKKKKLL